MTPALLARTVTADRGREVDDLVVEVLRAGESIITHRRMGGRWHRPHCGAGVGG